MNEQNLIPLNQRTKSEQREIAKKGGEASAVARWKKKLLRELLALANEETIEDMDAKDGQEKKIVLDAMAMRQLARAAASGDLKAIELQAKLRGELTDRHEFTGDVQVSAAPPQQLTAEERREVLQELKDEL